jgi:hypothetical protein
MNLQQFFSYDNWFPGFNAIIANIHQMATMTAFVILVAGLIFSIQANGIEGVLSPLFRTVVLAGLISIDGFAMTQIQTVSYGVADSILQDPFTQTFNAFIATMSGGGTTSSPLSWLFLASNSITMAIVGAICFLSGLIVLPILWLIYLFMEGLGRMGYAFLPIFIALIGTRRFSGMGTSYITSLIAIHLWPVGIAVVLTGTINLLNAQGGFAFTQNIPLLNSGPEAIKTLIAAGYTIVAIIAAPIVTQRAVTSAGQFGTQALGTMFGLGQTAASAGSNALAGAAASKAATASATQQAAQHGAIVSKLDQIATALGGGSGGGLGTPNTPASDSSSFPPSPPSTAPATASSPSSMPAGSAGGTAPRPAPAFAGGAGAGGSSTVGSGWTATAGGSILTPPSYSQARAQSGDMSGTTAARQLLSQSTISKPVMT